MKTTAVKMTVGSQWGRLTILSKAPSYSWTSKHGKTRYTAMWRCVCTCGNTTEARGPDLRNGNTASCGCKLVEQAQHMLVKRYPHLVANNTENA